LAHYLLKEIFGGIMLTRIVLTILLATTFAGTLSAQTRDAPEQPGPIASAATEELRKLDDQGAVRIERRRNDSVLNGALIGAAAGVASGLLYCRTMEPWEICNDAGPLARFGALGAAIGIGVDLLIREREVVYERQDAPQLHVSPMAGRGTRGVQVGLRF
jgi:hypothetical protein